MFHQFKDYFQFSRNERIGVILLISFLLLLIALKQSLIYFSPEPVSTIQQLDSLSAQLDRLNEVEKREKELKENRSSILRVEDFDPNKSSVSDWQKLGLSKKQAQVIKNYQAKAGDFRSKQEIKKMFVISDELYSKIAPHLLLPDTIAKKNHYKVKNEYQKEWETKPRVYPKVKINSADTAEFKKLSGIGNALATRIIKYRNELGGFNSKDQLKEVWGIPPETLIRLDSQLILDAVVIDKLSVNKSTIEELKSHPYIRWKVANSIVKYRKQHGYYLKLEDLKKSVLITDSIYDKIFPYLEL